MEVKLNFPQQRRVEQNICISIDKNPLHCHPFSTTYRSANYRSSKAMTGYNQMAQKGVL